MALKAVPLLFAVRGVLKGSLYTLQWTAMLSLLYLMEGVVRAWSDFSAVSSALAGVEIVLSLGVYLGAILYVRPAKQAARHG
ncbi:Putative membrane protein OS=Castellaniella defragrans OX=75697 GN=HNR28_002337 PE=4 SV=1 [Castellaniella defragrans]